MRELRIGRCTIYVWPEKLRVQFEDGAYIDAAYFMAHAAMYVD